MRLLYLIRTMTLALLLVATIPAAAQTTNLDALPSATQDEISRICLPVQFREGASAYRNCVQAELNLRSNGGATELGRLSFDDKYAVQQACAQAGGQSSSNYQSCVSSQISSLNKLAKPALNTLSEDELYVVQQSCFDAQSKQGAANYRQCLNDEVQSLLSIPAADTTNLNMVNKNALQLRCSSRSSNAVQYRKCVSAEFESIASIPPSFLPVDIPSTELAPVPAVASNESAIENETANEIVEAEVETETETEQPIQLAAALQETEAVSASSAAVIEPSPPINTQPVLNTQQTTTGDTLTSVPVPKVETIASAETRVISRPELIETLELQARAKAQGIELAPSTTSDTAAAAIEESSPMQKLESIWQKFLDTLASLDGRGWLLIAAVLALPAMLLGMFSLIRRVRKSEPAVPHNPALTDRIESGLQTRKARHELEAATLFDDEIATDPDHDAATRLASKPERVHLDQHKSQPAVKPTPQPADLSTAPEAIVKPAHRHEQATARPSTHATSGASEYPWQSAFGHWLIKQPETDRMEACIEFLIYWVAYGDDRYQPELKKRLFTATDLNSHDQIKRWVLKQDVFAFADVVGWMRSQATQQQLDQCVALIMALLVTEHCVTPVQNTLIRFLSDAFNIGKDQLERRFEQAFGHALPAISRTDNSAWWAKQESETVQRWDARSMTAKPETEQMLARLGLAANFDETQITNAFRRAARRCHPDRFTALGERERALAEQQFIKFEQARDKLLGVSV